MPELNRSSTSQESGSAHPDVQRLHHTSARSSTDRAPRLTSRSLGSEASE